MIARSTIDHMNIPADREWRKATASGVQNDCVELTWFDGEESDRGAGFAAVRDSKAVAAGGVPFVVTADGVAALVRFAAR